MIWPIKRFGGKQPYDTVNMTLITPHTAGNDDTGYWKNLEWNKAIEAGMKVSGTPYSGKFDFHQDPNGLAHHPHGGTQRQSPGLCRLPQQGRSPGWPGWHLHARQRHANRLVDKLGWGLALLVLIGVLGHGALRCVSWQDSRSNKMTERVYLFKGFERFWHWSQAALIIFMLLTGFEIHGTYANFGFERAVNYHTLLRRGLWWGCGCLPSSGMSPRANGASTYPPPTRCWPS
jgi:hypothetical protein